MRLYNARGKSALTAAAAGGGGGGGRRRSCCDGRRVRDFLFLPSHALRLQPPPQLWQTRVAIRSNVTKRAPSCTCARACACVRARKQAVEFSKARTRKPRSAYASAQTSREHARASSHVKALRIRRAQFYYSSLAKQKHLRVLASRSIAFCALILSLNSGRVFCLSSCAYAAATDHTQKSEAQTFASCAPLANAPEIEKTASARARLACCKARPSFFAQKMSYFFRQLALFCHNHTRALRTARAQLIENTVFFSVCFHEVGDYSFTFLILICFCLLTI